MADPLTLSIAVLSILSSASAYTTRTNDLLKRARNCDAELESQLYEIQVVCELLEECHGIIQASQNTQIPYSVERALEVCQRRYLDLTTVMERVRHLKHESNSAMARLQRGAKLIVTEHERKAAFQAFRTTVLLLRDLCTDIRMQQQLVNMSAGLAELLVDQYDEDPSQDQDVSLPRHVYINEDDGRRVKQQLDHTLSVDMSRRWPKTKSHIPGRMLKDLITQNFTRNATIVLDAGTGPLPERVKFIHVRAKMDTGCNDNLITMDLVEEAGIDMAQLIEIPEDEQIELTMIEGAKSTPRYKINLTWYQDGDMKMRHSDFYVVKDGPFDMLVGSLRFAQDLDENGHPGLVVGKRSKKKADRKKEKEDHIKYLKEQQDQEARERDTQRANGTVQPIQNLPSPQAQVQTGTPSPSSLPSLAPVPQHTSSTSAGQTTPTAPRTSASTSANPSQHGLQPPAPAVLRNHRPSFTGSQLGVLFPRQPTSIPLNILPPASTHSQSVPSSGPVATTSPQQNTTQSATSAPPAVAAAMQSSPPPGP